MIKRNRSHLLGGLVVASLCATTAAHADSVSDFKTGSTLYLRSGLAYAGNQVNITGGITLGKPANNLTFSIPASQFGLPWPLSVTFTPVSTTPSTITYSLSEQSTGPVDVTGNGDMLSSLSGTVVATLEQVPGNEPTVGNVRLHIPLTTLVAHGTWGAEAISVRAELIGGSLPSRLKNFTSEADGVVVCSDVYPTAVQLSVALEHPAPSAGQTINFTSADNSFVSVPSATHVQPGVTSGGATATIASNYVGTMRLTAAANGAVAFLDLQIHAHADCVHKSRPVAVNWNPECPQCNEPVWLTDRGETLALKERSPQIFTSKELIDLLATFHSSGATAITATNLTATGFVTGMVTIHGAQRAYVANYRSEPNLLHVLDSMTPAFVNASGVVVGSDTVSGQLRAVYNTGTGVKALALPFGATSSRATMITDSGEIIGTFTPPGGAPQGFRSRPTATIALPTVGVVSGIAVAANATGQIAANGHDAAGQPVAAIIAANNRPQLLGSPAGYTGFALRSINKAGWAVGVASSAAGAGQRAFVWIPNQGFTALSGYTSALSVADDALQIDDHNNVVLHGTNAGVTNFFVLSL